MKNIKTLGKFRVDEVLPFTGPKAPRREYTTDNGEVLKVKMRSLRYQTFKKSLVCVCCGIKGTYMALQRFRHEQSHQAHFNLYGLDERGKPVLITKDHIEPKSAGGKDHVDNMQTMCTVCNGLKKHHPMTVDQLKKVYDCYKSLRNQRDPKLGKKQVMRLVEAEIESILTETNEQCASSHSQSNQ